MYLAQDDSRQALTCLWAARAAVAVAIAAAVVVVVVAAAVAVVAVTAAELIYLTDLPTEP